MRRKLIRLKTKIVDIFKRRNVLLDKIVLPNNKGVIHIYISYGFIVKYKFVFIGKNFVRVDYAPRLLHDRSTHGELMSGIHDSTTYKLSGYEISKVLKYGAHFVETNNQ